MNAAYGCAGCTNDCTINGAVHYCNSCDAGWTQYEAYALDAAAICTVAFGFDTLCVPDTTPSDTITAIESVCALRRRPLPCSVRL